MGKVKIPYYVVRKGRGYWLVTKRMRGMGFTNVRCGPDGPEAWRIAQEWNERWQRARTGREAAQLHIWPKGSLGEAFERFRRTETWAAKKSRTREDWDRGWTRIEAVFGDVAPRSVSLEHVDAWYHALKVNVGVREAHRAVKIWRALWQVAASMHYCHPDHDPTFGIRRETPKARSATWTEGEIVRLAKGAWKAGYRGLACIVAAAWDTGFSPVDVRTLAFRQSRTDGQLVWFEIDRAKTGQPAIGTLSRRTAALVRAYISELAIEFHPDAAIFRTRGYSPGPKGGRPRPGAPYTKDSLVDDFACVRRLVFGPDEKRRLMDMRRSGAVEAMAGGADAGALSAKLANTISDSKALQRTYLPVDRATVDLADEARKRGRRRIAENKQGRKVETLRPGELKLAAERTAK